MDIEVKPEAVYAGHFTVLLPAQNEAIGCSLCMYGCILKMMKDQNPCFGDKTPHVFEFCLKQFQNGF